MQIIDAFPRPVREILNQWIPLSDGIRLAARIWLPEDAAQDPVPAILEYIPYRKNDLTAARDVQHHKYMAGFGYACVRVDLRGSGESEGILRDEYLQQEIDDGVEVIGWLAAQPWCSGPVAMMGISWGGFNALQIAAMQPAALRAVITVCSTDDRYADDVHHMGGCLLGDNLSWASTMFSHNSCPPDPEIVGGAWKKMWMERLKKSGLWLAQWLEHQRRDAFWKHGSVCENYSAIQCPVMAVSGWADGYSNAVFRLLANLEGPRKGLIGPWSHLYPHMGHPGPAIGFLQEALRWWDTWLKGVDTGIMEEPMLRVWMQDSVAPTTNYDHRPGRWVAENHWPTPDTVQHVFHLGFAWLGPLEKIQETLPLSVQSPLSVGLFAGKWCSYSAPPDLPHDQRDEDGGALIFDSDRLEQDMEILGPPVVELDIAASRPVAMIAVRLSDILPDDKATRVTYGLLNLTHRDSHEHPQPLEPGKRYQVTVQLNHIAQKFPAGNRIRLALSTVYWPLAWPPPDPARLTIYTKTSRLVLPVRPPNPRDSKLRAFAPPEAAVGIHKTLIQPTRQSWTVIRDLARDESRLEVVNDEGVYRIDALDLEIAARMEENYFFSDDDYTSLKGETRWVRRFKRKDWEVRTNTRTLLTSSPTHFQIRAELDAYEGESRVFSQSWDERIPRDLV
ncbi:MAG: CocE/NonD family hydrolase [Desulfobacterales bacterium]|nr:CocE/NonD family hydrolase [Desulfobacterales bacterium]